MRLCCYRDERRKKMRQNIDSLPSQPFRSKIVERKRDSKNPRKSFTEIHCALNYRPPGVSVGKQHEALASLLPFIKWLSETGSQISIGHNMTSLLWSVTCNLDVDGDMYRLLGLNKSVVQDLRGCLAWLLDTGFANLDEVMLSAIHVILHSPPSSSTAPGWQSTGSR